MSERSAGYFLNRERAERAAAAAAASQVACGIHLELAERYAEEAKQCRHQATRYHGRQEHHFLLRVASSFDELASAQSDRAGRTDC